MEDTTTCKFFDGRCYKALYLQVKAGKQVLGEEHVTIVKEPRPVYIRHITPSSGQGEHLAVEIPNLKKMKGIEISTLESVGCDATVVTTGQKNGVHTILEQQLEKSLQWIVCLLHRNELPLYHLINWMAKQLDLMDLPVRKEKVYQAVGKFLSYPTHKWKQKILTLMLKT